MSKKNYFTAEKKTKKVFNVQVLKLKFDGRSISSVK